ncbi:helix-turn-helix domain-containing protein [Paramagnetospirillum kuznetsovii]|nr:helix-turn-helix transcriptional regulator [Paramagnetospirillum kuznetsovii]
MTPAQCRAARAMLGWSQDKLAGEAKVAKQTLADFERGARTPYPRTLADILKALEVAGVGLVDDELGVGVRLSRR